MKLLILSTGLLLIHGRPQMTGFNPGTDSEKTGSGSGYNAGSGGDQGSDYDESAIHYPDESQGDSGYNAGNSGSGFNPHIPDFVPDESITNPGGMGASGFNPGISQNAPLKPSNRPDSNTGGSGFNPGRTGDSGFNPGSNQNTGFNPGRTGDSGFNPGSNQNTGFNPGSNQNNGFNPGSPGSGAPGFGGFKTPIIFADDNEVEVKAKPASSLPPYMPGGDKRPYLREDNPVDEEGEEEEEDVRVLLLQPVAFNPQLETSPGNSFIAAQTLPSGVQFAGVPTGPYVPGTNKQQYLRGRQQTDIRPAQGIQTFPAPIMTPHTRPFPRRPAPVPADSALVSLLTAANPLTGGATAQTLPGEIVFAATSERKPYVPGTNKQQYLRGGQPQTEPFTAEETDVQYVPLIQVRANLPAQTLPSEIVFDESYVPGSNKQQFVKGGPQTKPFLAQYAPLVRAGVAQSLPSPIAFDEGYVPGSNKQQYVRGESQAQYVPLLRAGIASTLPSPIVFNEGYVPGSNKQQYVRGGNIGVQTLPSPIVFHEDYAPGSNKEQYVREGPLVTVGDAQTLPSPITGVRAPYVPGGNKQQYLRSGAQSSAYPGVSARPSFPPGYYPSLGLGRMVQGESQVAYESQQGPKNVLYFF